MSGSSRRNRLARGSPILALLVPFLSAGRATAVCDPDVRWEIYSPTGDVAEILVDGQTAWVGAQGGVVRVDLTGVSSGDPAQVKIADREGLISTRVSALARDALGDLWVGTVEDGVSIFDAAGRHLMDLSSFDALWSDLVISMAPHGDRMFIASADRFTPQGTLDGGGFVMVRLIPDGQGGVLPDTVQAIAGPPVEVAHEIFPDGSSIWFGTSGDGLWVRDESVVPAEFRRELTTAQGLLSANVKKVLRGPKFGGGEVLWLGTGAGLQSYDPQSGVLEAVADFAGQNILDLHRSGSVLWVLGEQGGQRDLYRLDLAATPVAVRIPRSDCFSDTLYVPRQVAVDSTGRIVLGTRLSGYTVREGLDWYCPPPLGPHHPQIADLAIHPDGTLYFGTGFKPPGGNFTGNGVGVKRADEWSSLRPPVVEHPNMTEMHVWSDSTVWMGSSVDASQGGLTRYFPRLGTAQAYHNAVQDLSRRTLGRHVRALETDAAGNLWVCYGQNPGGGLSCIELGSMRITNYDFGTIFAGTNLLRDLAFDSDGRIWVTTTQINVDPAKLYVLDTRGTPANRADDRVWDFTVPTEIADLGEDEQLEIDGANRIWIAGQKGLVIGDLVAGSWPPSVAWRRVTPTATQLGGRNPLPYKVARLDWNDDLWLGTETSGLVRISRDLETWTWFDQIEGCPLPDQAIRGIYVEDLARRVWVGTASGGIARIDLSGARRPGAGEGMDPLPSPNPWRPDVDPALQFRGISPDITVDLHVFTLAGELVHEQLGVRGEKSWDGTNLRGIRVDAGVYLVTAKSASGATFEGKVAVIR